jgi:hypothetical protein
MAHVITSSYKKKCAADDGTATDNASVELSRVKH